MADKYLNDTGLAYYHSRIKPKLAPDVTTSDNGKILKVSNGTWVAANETQELPSVTASDNGKVLQVVNGAWAKNKVEASNVTYDEQAAQTQLGATVQEAIETLDYNLAGVASDASKAAFSNVKVGANIIAANIRQDTLELVAGNKITLTPDATNDKVTIAAQDELPTVTASDNGKVLAVANGQWSVNAIPDATSSTKGIVKVDSTISHSSTNPLQNRVIADLLDTKLDSDAGFTGITYVGDETDPGSAHEMRIGAYDTEYATVLAPRIVVDNSLNSDSKILIDASKYNYDSYGNPSSTISSTKITVSDSNGISIDSANGVTINGEDPTNLINSVKVAGVALTPDSNKAVDIPYATSSTKGVVIVDNAMSSSSTNPVQNSVVKAYVDSAMAGGATFQGAVNAGTDISSLTAYNAGWYWVVQTAGTYVGQTCEVGDMIYCINNYSSAYSASDFSVVQKNVDMTLYWAKSELTAITTAEIDTLFA